MHKLLKTALLAGASVILPNTAHAAIDANVSFTPATRYPGEESRLKLVLQNSSLDPSTSVQIENVLPDDVFISATPDLTSDCGGTVTANNLAAHGVVKLTGGTIPGGDGTNPGVCTIAVDVQSAKKGTYTNTLAAGELTGVTGGVSESSLTAAQATLAIILQDVTVSIAADLPSVQGYETSVVRITVNNPNPVPLTNMSFYQDLWRFGYNFRIRDDLPKGSDCGANLVVGDRPSRGDAYGPTSDLTVSGGTIPANGSCEVFYTVEPSRDPLRPYFGSRLTQYVQAGDISTNEGATNAERVGMRMSSYVGTSLQKYFDFRTGQTININDTDTSLLRLYLRSVNTQPVENISISDTLPDGMTVESVQMNTCGGTLTTTPNNQISLSGFSLPAVTANDPNIGNSICEVRAVVKVAGKGTYENTIPAGTFNGTNEYDQARAVLTVDGTLMEIKKSFSRSGTTFAGDTTNLVFNIENFSPGTLISNINFVDDLAAMGYGVRVGPNGVVGNSCGGTVTAVPESTSVSYAGLSVAPKTTCRVTVQLITAADALARITTATGGSLINTIPVGDITFDTPTQTNITYEDPVSANLTLYAPVLLYKSFNPGTVGPLGVSRLRVNITRRSSDLVGMSNISLLDPLPTGHVVADDPDVFNGCGGTLSADPGASSIRISGFDMPMQPTSYGSVQCYFEVNVRSAPLSPGLTTQADSNIIPGDAATGERVYFIATDDRQPAPYNEVRNRRPAYGRLVRQAAAVTMSKEFTPATINGGGVSRVKITFANTDSNAINLTGVRLTDDFSATDMRLFSDVNPTFTDLNGNANSNGCSGGVFSGSGGANQFSMSNARIDRLAICKLEFNVTAFRGGNHINRINAGDLVSAEGVTNISDVSATLTVGYQIGVGKGFNPPVIEAGAQSTLTLDIYNTNVAPNDQTGASPAIIDTMPAGLQIVPGTAITNCPGGTASSGVDGSGSSFLRLDGGLFRASSACQVQAKVTTSTTGAYLNQIPVGALSADDGTQSPDPAEATLRVIQPPTIQKIFSPSSIAAGDSTNLVFNITNPNDAALLPAGMTGIRFSDTLNNMEVAGPLVLNGTCQGYQTDATIGATSFNVSNISLAPGATCSVQLPITSSVVGLHDNQVSGASSDQTVAPGAPSNVASLRVLEPLTLTKSFAQPAIAPDQPVRMTFTISNSNPSTVTLLNPGFTDIFPTSPGLMTVAPQPNISSTCSSMLVRNLEDIRSPIAGDIGVLVRGGNIPANSSCNLNIDVVVSGSGEYVNTVPALYSRAGASPGASANLFGISIAAVNDSVEGINGHQGASSVVNVLAGDTINEANATASNATLSLASGSAVPDGLSFDTSTGDVSVAAGTAAGSYSFEYQICENGSTLNCTTASVTVTVAASADLSITKTNTPGENGEVDQPDDSVISGSNTTYTIVVRNNGPDAVTGAVVKDTVASGLTCPAANPLTITGQGVPSGSFTIGDLTGEGVTLGNLADGQATTISYSCEVE